VGIESLPSSSYHVAASVCQGNRRVGNELLASGFDYGDEFEFGLDLIPDGIGRVLQGT
jgi:hypothetical protein